MSYGPNNELVEAMLNWIASGNLLSFRGPRPPEDQYILVPDLKTALSLAYAHVQGTPGWTELRDNADATMFRAGLLDEPEWIPYKQAIDDLLIVIGDKVDAALPDKYRKPIDDVIADLRACITCMAVHGKLDSFHSLLWGAYQSGGWPCGMTSLGKRTVDFAEDPKRWRMNVFWEEKPKA